MTRKLLNFLFRLGLFDVLHYANLRRLTVLCYHRIEDPTHLDFDTFKPNVSATPEAFAEQINFISRRFNVISIDQLRAWLAGEARLPRYPALITFDDGYHDNFVNAYPVLSAANVPSVIFLATDYINATTPFYWDLAAYCFHHTAYDSVTLPVLGPVQWSTPEQKQTVLVQWLEILKTLSDAEKHQIITDLPVLLDVTVPEDTFAGMFLTWEQVREMAQNGITMGAHTQSHPILTRISLEDATQELQGSKQRIESEIKLPVTSLAYPNGGSSDFNPAIQTSAQELGFDVAFSLIVGPTSRNEARHDPMAIRRIFIGHKDTMPRFAAKVSGFRRLINFSR